VLEAPFGKNAADLENNEALDSSTKYRLLFSAVKTLNHSSSGGLFQSKLQHGQPQATMTDLYISWNKRSAFLRCTLGKTKKPVQVIVIL